MTGDRGGRRAAAALRRASSGPAARRRRRAALTVTFRHDGRRHRVGHRRRDGPPDQDGDDGHSRHPARTVSLGGGAPRDPQGRRDPRRLSVLRAATCTVPAPPSMTHPGHASVQAGERTVVALSSLDIARAAQALLLPAGRTAVTGSRRSTSTTPGATITQVPVPRWRLVRAPTLRRRAGAALRAHRAGLPACPVGTRAPTCRPGCAGHRPGRHAPRHALHRLHVQRLRAACWRSCAGWRRRSRRNACSSFLASWDGRYYWDYPTYTPSARMGGEAGFRAADHRGAEARLHR